MTTTRTTKSGNELRITEIAHETFRLEFWFQSNGRWFQGTARVAHGSKALRKMATEMAKN